MREGLSHRIVAFIGGLLPLYTHEHVGERYGARSLVDGTLILPLDEPEEDEDGRVEVYWQGDSTRRSEIAGAFLASVAVAKYAELHAIPEASATKARYAHMSQHFTFKTDAYLLLEEPDPESAVAEMLKEASKLLGKEAVKEIVKKAIGL